MLKSLYHDSRKFFSRLREEVAPPMRVVLEIPSERDLFEAMAAGLSPVLDEAKAAYQAGNRESAVSLLTSYFRGRRSPQFFASAEQIKSGVDELQRSRPEWVDRTLGHADQLTQGVINVYAQKARLGNPRDWAEAPLGPGNDMLYRYRPHRFGFTPRLALAALYGHQEALKTLEKMLADWEASVHPKAELTGKYRTFRTSSHVAVYRSIAATWVLGFLGAASNCRSEELELTLLRIILGDARHINASIPHTTANNHLLADGFGAWYLGSLYPEFVEAASWKTNGKPVFETQLLRQIYTDGTSFEQSVHYQEHICEMGVAYLLLCRRNGWQVDRKLTERISAMLDFQATLTGSDGAVFAIGDTTEDPLFPLDGKDAWCGVALRSMQGALFGGSGLAAQKEMPQLERSFWLSGACFAEQNAAKVTAPIGISCYPIGGYALLWANRGRDRLLFRTGPPPQVKLTSGHMHFDFLSVYLVIDGVPVIVDSGTYTYRASPPGWAWKHGNWRPYFMSAQAANGLALSESDPLLRGIGDFPSVNNGDIGCRVTTCRPLAGQALILISAEVMGPGEHAGWMRSILQLKDEYWLVIDEYSHHDDSAPGSFGYQFPVGTSVSVEDELTVHASVGDSDLLLIFSSGLQRPACLEGSTRPMGGWLSSAYGHIASAPQLKVKRKPTTTISACVLARTDSVGGTPQNVSIQQCEEEISIRVVLENAEDHFRIKATTVPSSSGRTSWVRSNNGRIIEEESI